MGKSSSFSVPRGLLAETEKIAQFRSQHGSLLPGKSVLVSFEDDVDDDDDEKDINDGEDVKGDD